MACETALSKLSFHYKHEYLGSLLYIATLAFSTWPPFRVAHKKNTGRHHFGSPGLPNHPAGARLLADAVDGCSDGILQLRFILAAAPVSLT